LRRLVEGDKLRPTSELVGYIEKIQVQSNPLHLAIELRRLYGIEEGR
jgi:hypothetical protein